MKDGFCVFRKCEGTMFTTIDGGCEQCPQGQWRDLYGTQCVPPVDKWGKANREALNFVL